MQLQTIVHTIPPLYDSESRVLLLGSIPSPKSREVGFFYGHPQNRFWRVPAAVLGEDVPVSIEDKRAMCLRHHVALWDTIAKCDIAGASDTSIRNAEPNDIGRLLRESKINAHFCHRRQVGAACTANSSSRKPACPSRSCPPPVPRTPHGRSRG